MPKPKQELTKKTLNLRTGDFEKMGEMFPDLGSSAAVRELLSRFVDRHYTQVRGDKSLAEDTQL